jgi:hypothetical protein
MIDQNKKLCVFCGLRGFSGSVAKNTNRQNFWLRRGAKYNREIAIQILLILLIYVAKRQ